MKRGMLCLAVAVVALMFASCAYAPGTSDGGSSLLSGSWVIMVYMAADNNLEGFALGDLNEMESINALSRGVRIIALVDRSPREYSAIERSWSNTRLYEIRYDPQGYNNILVSTPLYEMGLTPGGNEKLNMGNMATLSNFIAFCMSNYAADHYALVLWNHGSGWTEKLSVQGLSFSQAAGLGGQEFHFLQSVGWSETFDDFLSMAEVKAALAGRRLSLIGFDACYMGMIEVAYQIREHASIMVGSQEIEKGDGWDYRGLLSRFIASDLSPNALARAIVHSYGDFYAHWDRATMSAIDLGRMGELVLAVNVFAENLTNADRNSVRTGRTNAQQFSHPPYVDLYSLASHLTNISGAYELMNALRRTVLYEVSGRGVDAHGLSIYFPASRNHRAFNDYHGVVIDFPRDSLWDEFLHWYTTIPPDAYEPNDVFSSAKMITNGESQQHSFHVSNDVDYLTFEASAHESVRIETFSPADNVDTIVSLYATDGVTFLMENDDKSLFSRQSMIEWIAPASGMYLIAVKGRGDVGEYSIKLTRH